MTADSQSAYLGVHIDDVKTSDIVWLQGDYMQLEMQIAGIFAAEMRRVSSFNYYQFADIIWPLYKAVEPERAAHGPLILRRVDRASIVPHVSHHPGSATCGYCRKTILTWGRSKSRRSFDDAQTRVLFDHQGSCAAAWARRLAAIVASECDVTHTAALARWRASLAHSQYYGPGRPPSREQGLVEKHVFDNLPQPHGSEYALAVEMFLVKFHDLVQAILLWKRPC